jgi:hypothetical protein
MALLANGADKTSEFVKMMQGERGKKITKTSPLSLYGKCTQLGTKIALNAVI